METIEYDSPSWNDRGNRICDNFGGTGAIDGDVCANASGFGHDAVGYAFLVCEDEAICETKLLCQMHAGTRRSGEDHAAGTENPGDLTRDQPGGTGTEHENGFTWMYAAFGNGRPYFHVENGGCFIGDGGGNGEDILPGNDQVPLRTSIRGDAELGSGGAELTTASLAKVAMAASEYLVDSDAVSGLKATGSRSDGDDPPSNFVAQDARGPCHLESSFNDVYVGSADANGRGLNKDFMITELGRHGGITVPEMRATLPYKLLQAAHLVKFGSAKLVRILPDQLKDTKLKGVMQADLGDLSYKIYKKIAIVPIYYTTLKRKRSEEK